MKEITITSLEEGQRLDRVLQRYLSGASAGFLYKMLRKKNITLNGGKADGSEKLSRGDTIRIYFSQETLEKFASPQENRVWPLTELEIVYEDEQILLVNKSAGMLTQKAALSDVSLNEYAIGYLLKSGALSAGSLSSFRPSVCNRLDRNTSGIVAVGKTSAALRELSGMFRDRTIHKYYHALVTGNVKTAETIDGYLVKDERKNQVRILRTGTNMSQERAAALKNGAAHGFGGQSVSGKKGGAQRIVTAYVPIGHRTDPEPERELTLLEISLITGRSHQIRAHLASRGHPVVGDPKYGDRKRNEYFARSYRLHTQLLHAAKIVFPKTNGVLGYLSGREFTAKRPQIFEQILEAEGVRIP